MNLDINSCSSGKSCQLLMLMGVTPLCDNHVYTLNYLFNYRLRSFPGSRFPCSSCSNCISNLLTSIHLSYKLGLFNSQSTKS